MAPPTRVPDDRPGSCRRRGVRGLRGVHAACVALLLLSGAGCRDGTGPLPAPPGPWLRIETGGRHSCALGEADAAYCWGMNRTGQLGVPTTLETRGVPTLVADGLRYVKLYAGDSHTCGLDAEGRAYCWGYNNSGQLGNPFAPIASDRPVPAAGGGLFASLGVGGYHTCGLRADGQAFCWGWNAFGQLGNGAVTSRVNPVPVVGGHRFTGLAAGDRHTCALNAEGRAYCWGLGARGELGAANLPDLCGPTNALPCSRVPIPVAGDHRFAALFAGYGHTCGLDAYGAAFCWGWGEFGQLGNGGTGEAANRQTPVPVSGNVRFLTLAAGGGFTCGLDMDGAAFCWGFNEHGQLGNGGPESRPEPVAVAGGHRFSAIAAGSWHACALTPDGDAYCWGRNESRQLGDGSTAERRVPVRVGGV